MSATGDDWLRAARGSDDPQAALLYYATAESLGVEDPGLWRERHELLQRLGHAELSYLNARCGPWRDEAVVRQTAEALQNSSDTPRDFPDTVETFDAEVLLQEREHARALAVCKFIVRRDEDHRHACYLAGVCMLQIRGAEGEALTWLNLAERLEVQVGFYISYNRALLLRRVGLHLPALHHAAELVRKAGASEQSRGLYLGILEDLLRSTLTRENWQPILDGMRFLQDQQKAYYKPIISDLEHKCETAGTNSIADRVFEAASEDRLEAAGNLLYSAAASEVVGELLAIASKPGQSDIAVKRTFDLLLATTLIDGPIIAVAVRNGAWFVPHERCQLEFAARWTEAAGRTGSPLAALAIGRLLAAHLTHPEGRVHLVLDDPAVYQFLRSSELPDAITLHSPEAPPTGVPITAETLIALITRPESAGSISLPPSGDLLILLAPGLQHDVAEQLAGFGEPPPRRVPQVELAGWSLWVRRRRSAAISMAGPLPQDAQSQPADEAHYTDERGARMFAALHRAYENRLPFSYVRLSDAETVLMGIGRDIPENTVPVRPASFFVAHLGIDPAALGPQQLRPYQDELYEACLDADILMTHRGFGADIWSVTADRVLRAYPGYVPYRAREVSNDFQAELLEGGMLLQLLAERRILLIGNAAPRFRALLSDPEYRARYRHIGMPQSRINIVQSLFVPHQGDAAFRLLDRLWEEVAIHAFDVALIAASVTGKFLAGRIKKHLGGMALDIGYHMQLLTQASSPVARVDAEAMRRRGYERAVAIE